MSHAALCAFLLRGTCEDISFFQMRPSRTLEAAIKHVSFCLVENTLGFWENHKMYATFAFAK